MAVTAITLFLSFYRWADLQERSSVTYNRWLIRKNGKGILFEWFCQGRRWRKGIWERTANEWFEHFFVPILIFFPLHICFSLQLICSWIRGTKPQRFYLSSLRKPTEENVRRKKFILIHDWQGRNENLEKENVSFVTWLDFCKEECPQKSGALTPFLVRRNGWMEDRVLLIASH